VKSDLPDAARRVLPRWRGFEFATQLGELDSASPVTDLTPDPAVAKRIAKLVSDFERDQDDESAIELLNGSFVLGSESQFRQAFSFIGKSNANAPLVLNRSPDVNYGPHQSEAPPSDQQSLIRHEISRCKSRVRRSPRDAISWMELARGYCMLGQITKCRNAVNVALALAPHNRYVLRSAARFFIHANDSERSAQLLRNAPRTKHDPWLIAAEISCSTVANTPSKFMNSVKRGADNRNWSPRNQAEMHAAAATTIAADGSIKQAKKLLRLSIRDPNENALTQAEWAKIQGWGIDAPSVQTSSLLVPEALALRARQECEWVKAVDNCMKWYSMEPTSSRPLRLAIFICLVALEDGKRALEFLTLHQMLDPHYDRLYNDFAVAHAYCGNVTAAGECLERSVAASNYRTDMAAEVIDLATKGLVQFRKRMYGEGSECYSEAVKIAIDRKDRNLALQALWHFLREMTLIGVIEDVSEVVARIKPISETLLRVAPEYNSLIAGVEVAMTTKPSVKLDLGCSSKNLVLPAGFEWLEHSK